MSVFTNVLRGDGQRRECRGYRVSREMARFRHTHTLTHTHTHTHKHDTPLCWSPFSSSPSASSRFLVFFCAKEEAGGCGCSSSSSSGSSSVPPSPKGPSYSASDTEFLMRCVKQGERAGWGGDICHAKHAKHAKLVSVSLGVPVVLLVLMRVVGLPVCLTLSLLFFVPLF